MGKAERLRIVLGAFLLALLVSLSGVALSGCGATEEGKKEAKEEAEKKEQESQQNQEESK